MLGKTDTEIGEMSLSQAARWAWFMDKFPMGEEAMDLRFQALRMDISAGVDAIRCAIYSAVDGKRRQPAKREFGAFRLFKRFFVNHKDDFTTMNPQAVSDKMKSIFGRSSQKKGK